MITDIKMPRLSDSMEEGTILEWRKAVGDSIATGEEIAEIETDKATMLYEADVSGVLTEIVAEAGEIAAVGAVIARVGDSADEVGRQDTEAVGREDTADAPRQEPVAAALTAQVSPESRPAVHNGAGGDRGRVVASPLARRIAERFDIDLGQLEGTGPAGRIVKLDVEAARDKGERVAPRAAGSSSTGTAKGEVETIEPTRIQQLVARRMSESKATAPHIYLTRQIDMSYCVAARSRLKASRKAELVPSFNDMVVRACAMALRAYPRVNGAYLDGRFELYSRVNIGIAVATPDSLVVPTVFDADRKSLHQIASESRTLAEDVRQGTITPPQLSGGTFTVSNLGMYGISNFGAVINPPQAGILAVGEIAEAPVVRDDSIAVGHLMEVTLACDHRILGGAEGAAFLVAVADALTQPAVMVGSTSAGL